ncbi:MAG: alpha/beta hydrolase [Woeseiaceae bacterium]
MSSRAKPVVVLIPGMGNNARLWSAQVEDLSGDHEVIVADYLGAVSIDEMSDRVLSQVPSGSFSLVGFSLGGYIALNLIGRVATRVDRLAFISASPYADSEQAMEQRERLMQKAREDYDAVLADMGHFIVCKDGPRADETRKIVSQMGRELGVEEFCRQQQAAMRRADSRSQLAQIECPVQVLCGADDRVTPVSGNRYLAEHIPAATLQVLEQTGHLLPLERPKEVSAFLRDWLTRETGEKTG